MQKKTIVLGGFIVLKFVLQYLLIHPGYELHRDEFLHLDQGRHLALGYISVPPFTSWISFLIQLLGNGVFWVKFFPALFGVLTLVVVWQLIEELKGGLFALVLGSLCVVFSAILRINILYQPNTFDVFFWTLTYYTLIKFINTAKPAWLYATGISLAFGFLSKYNILILAAGLFPALLLTRHRKIFASKHFYYSLLLGLLIVLPNLFWQYKNNFPTLAQLKELADTQLVNVNRVGFIKDQFLFFLNCIFVILAALVGLIIYPAFQRYRFVLISYAICLALFVFFKAKSYYAIGLYPVLLVFGAVYFEHIFSTGWRAYLRPVSIAVLLLLFVPFIVLAFPILSPAFIASHPQYFKPIGILRWEDGKEHQLPQDNADMIGWRELAQKTDSVYNTVFKTGPTLVLCDNYGEAGAINYYSSFKNIQAVSFNADYINWMPLDKRIRNVILVKDGYDEDSTRETEKPLFKKVAYMGEITNPYAREKGTKIYLLQDARADINARIEEERQRKLSHQK